ncbi:hypothetical protein KIPB_009123 [Kipferlia bialata]|uniref:USP domain-containing protein n=1 Tax=Kipferlia bialata TaxID=797122 RepID=A0A9K3D2Y1_9EUKA|nr:hypothetical protein KIPB_009123 [Kipferlia bialata]|eukprot:g9123.t1
MVSVLTRAPPILNICLSRQTNTGRKTHASVAFGHDLEIEVPTLKDSQSAAPYPPLDPDCTWPSPSAILKGWEGIATAAGREQVEQNQAEKNQGAMQQERERESDHELYMEDRGRESSESEGYVDVEMGGREASESSESEFQVPLEEREREENQREPKAEAHEQSGREREETGDTVVEEKEREGGEEEESQSDPEVEVHIETHIEEKAQREIETSIMGEETGEPNTRKEGDQKEKEKERKEREREADKRREESEKEHAEEIQRKKEDTERERKERQIERERERKKEDKERQRQRQERQIEMEREREEREREKEQERKTKLQEEREREKKSPGDVQRKKEDKERERKERQREKERLRKERQKERERKRDLERRERERKQIERLKEAKAEREREREKKAPGKKDRERERKEREERDAKAERERERKERLKQEAESQSPTQVSVSAPVAVHPPEVERERAVERETVDTKGPKATIVEREPVSTHPKEPVSTSSKKGGKGDLDKVEREKRERDTLREQEERVQRLIRERKRGRAAPREGVYESVVRVTHPEVEREGESEERTQRVTPDVAMGTTGPAPTSRQARQEAESKREGERQAGEDIAVKERETLVQQPHPVEGALSPITGGDKGETEDEGERETEEDEESSSDGEYFETYEIVMTPRKGLKGGSRPSDSDSDAVEAPPAKRRASTKRRGKSGRAPQTKGKTNWRFSGKKAVSELSTSTETAYYRFASAVCHLSDTAEEGHYVCIVRKSLLFGEPEPEREGEAEAEESDLEEDEEETYVVFNDECFSIVTDDLSPYFDSVASVMYQRVE